MTRQYRKTGEGEYTYTGPDSEWLIARDAYDPDLGRERKGWSLYQWRATLVGPGVKTTVFEGTFETMRHALDAADQRDHAAIRRREVARDFVAIGEPATLLRPDGAGGAGYLSEVYDAEVRLAPSAGLDYSGGTIAALTVILTDGTQATVEMNRDALKRLADRVWTILFETYQYAPVATGPADLGSESG